MIRYIRKKVNTENKSPYTYNYGPTKLKNNFTMTKALLSLRRDDGRIIQLQTKFMLACLIESSAKTSTYPRLLTTTRRLGEHFKMPPRLIQKFLNNIQNIKVNGTPLAMCREYVSDKNIPNLKPRERAIEILITGYDSIKYIGDKKDFFFDVDLDLYSDELDTTSRVFLFMLQSIICQNIQKKMPPMSFMFIETYASRFGFDVEWVRRIIKTLKSKKFIEVAAERRKLHIYLTKKGWRDIERFASISSTNVEK